MNQDLYDGDCFAVFNDTKFIKKYAHKVDLVLVDLPYGQTKLKWDEKINLKSMWEHLDRITKSKCVYVFFCTTRFGAELINSNPRSFRYDLVWKKSKTTGFLNSNRCPLREHEMIYIFRNRDNEDKEKNRNMGLRDYFKTVFEFIGKPTAKITTEVGYRALGCFRFNQSQFGLCSQGTYDILISKYSINDMQGFRKFDDIKREWDDENKPTYNPQKTKGKPYTSKGGSKVLHYGSTKTAVVNAAMVNTGTRYPASILRFNNPKKSIHPTQKPVNLCEWLIKTYSNEGDTVLDFTMGSGTTGEACHNTNRNFIGIEKDPAIFKTASTRLKPPPLGR